MTTTDQQPCTAQCPKFPGLTCHLIGDHDGNHYSMGESWARSHIDKGEQSINLPPDQQRWTGTELISQATLDEISRVARNREPTITCPNGPDLTNLAPHRECPACGRQQYLPLSGFWTHCLYEAEQACRPVRACRSCGFAHEWQAEFGGCARWPVTP